MNCKNDIQEFKNKIEIMVDDLYKKHGIKINEIFIKSEISGFDEELNIYSIEVDLEA